MKKEEVSYLYLLAFHGLLGGLFFLLPLLSKAYALFILGFGVYYISKTKNNNNEALLMAAYVTSAEIVLRMTGGTFLNEYGKIAIVLFLLLGMIYTGFSKKTILFWFFLFLLLPGLVLSVFTLDLTTDVKKAIVFNISGPVCLGISAVYCYHRKISFDRLLSVVTVLSLPLISLLVYLYLYTPNVQDVITGTQSSFETSGGFGPNQVSTILGFGIFIFFVQFLLNSPRQVLQVINGGLVLFFAFRGLVTFSRGGIFTAVVMIILLLTVLYFQANFATKPKIAGIIVISILAAVGVWGYSSVQTKGLIDKRYANQDAAGREKSSQLSGREVLIESELKMFFENPILGVGVGKNKELRKQDIGIDLATHNELTRMLAEHGSLGVLALLILIGAPLFLFATDQTNLLALSFFAFWLLTINHAAMRLSAPAFIYALSLLKVYRIEQTTVHRK